MVSESIGPLRTTAYGHRGRLATIIPWDNAVLEPEFAGALPYGVTTNVLRQLYGPVERQVADAFVLAAAAQRLAARALLYGCVASVCLKSGLDDEAFCRDLSDAAGMPARTATSAMSEALAALGVRRLALLLPYPAAKCEAVRAYFASRGFEPVADHRLGMEPEPINLLSPRDVFEAALKVDTAGADALLLVATNLPTFEVLRHLQERLSIPVLSTNAALAWVGLRLLGVEDALSPPLASITVMERLRAARSQAAA